MKNQIDLPPEYWASLSIGADLFGYFSRHEMVVELLKTWVNSQPGLLDKGKERASLEGKVREVVMRDPASLLVEIPNLRSALKKRVHRYHYVEGGYKDVLAESPGDGYFKITGKLYDTVEFEKLFTHYEVLD